MKNKKVKVERPETILELKQLSDCLAACHAQRNRLVQANMGLRGEVEEWKTSAGEFQKEAGRYAEEARQAHLRMGLFQTEVARMINEMDYLKSKDQAREEVLGRYRSRDEEHLRNIQGLKNQIHFGYRVGVSTFPASQYIAQAQAAERAAEQDAKMKKAVAEEVANQMQEQMKKAPSHDEIVAAYFRGRAAEKWLNSVDKKKPLTKKKRK